MKRGLAAVGLPAAAPGAVIAVALAGDSSNPHPPIPKLLRPIFLRERSLLGELSRCLWLAVCRGLSAALGVRIATPGAVTSIASLGDAANPHPHIHGMFSDGAWYGTAADAAFLPWPRQLDSDRLTQLFRRLVLRILVRRNRLKESTAERMLGWEHSGFSVFLGDPIPEWNSESRQRLARYLVRTPLSLERLRYDQATCTVVYGAGKHGQKRELAALDFLAEVAAAIPDRGQHLVSHWGRHSNRSRGKRLKALEAKTGLATIGDEPLPEDETQPELRQKRKAFRIAWAALLSKVWNVDALVCPRCSSRMQIVAAITNPPVAERILKHAGLFSRPRLPNIHDCLTPPTAAHGQTLFAFPSRTRGVLYDADALAVKNGGQGASAVRPFGSDHPEQDPRLQDDWPVDPPFADD